MFSVGLIPENELAKNAGIELSPKTRGAVVYQNRQTLTEGVFACGNVLQVHDLVDYVSEEAELAGKSAAEYVLHNKVMTSGVNVVNGKNINYVLPQRIDLNYKQNVKVFFRVSNTFKNCTITATCGDKIIAKKSKKIVVPGEMETLLFTADKLENVSGDIELSLEAL